MSSKSIELIASVTSELPKLAPLNHYDLVRRLLKMEYEYFLLKGIVINELTEAGVLLHSEDLPLVFEVYEEVEQLLSANKPYDHNGFFADGLLTTNTKSDRNVVKFKLNYYPKLDKANLVTFTTTLTEAEYVQWWRSIVHQVVAVADRK